MSYITPRNRHRYLTPFPRDVDRLPIVTTVTPPVIAHVRTFAYIIACFIAALFLPAQIGY